MLASLIGAFISGEAMNVARRAKAAAIAYVLAAILFLAGLAFLVGAGYVAAARHFGSISAAVGFGVGFLVLGAIVLGIHAITASARRRQKNRRGIDLAAIAGAAAVSGLPLLFKRGGLAGLMAPLLALLAFAVYRENRSEPPDDPDLPNR
jgi:uncharacterized membrane protein (DUF485 family)